jgi:hypothetical protein
MTRRTGWIEVRSKREEDRVAGRMGSVKLGAGNTHLSAVSKFKECTCEQINAATNL